MHMGMYYPSLPDKTAFGFCRGRHAEYTSTLSTPRLLPGEGMGYGGEGGAGALPLSPT